MACVSSRLDNYSWGNALSRLSLPCRDVYFTPAYHELHVANGDGEAFCTSVSEGGAVLLVPGLRTPISVSRRGYTSSYSDVQSCNGYGGPLASQDATHDFLEEAWAEWRRRCSAEGIVAAFFRLHPVLDNKRWLPADTRVVLDRQTVLVDLTDGLEAAWQRTDPRHRNMVRKGKRENACVRWDDPNGWDEFESLYQEAMARLEAPQSLRFSPAYFAGLRDLAGAELACVRTGGKLDAAAVFMFGPCWSHYHLSARRADSGNHLTNCILQAAIERTAQRGLSGVHLGGGRSRDPLDRLLKFKLSLGGRLLDFRVALVIADADAYNDFCRQWADEVGAMPEWLMGYRQPKPKSHSCSQQADS